MTSHWLRQIWAYRSTLIIILTPLLLLPLPLILQAKEASCGYIILLMAIYWITEAVPLAVTAFLPLILFPLTGIMTSKEVSRAYFVDINWLFIGGLMIAVAIENSGLHKRIALRVLLLFGTKPRCLMFGFMATTFFLSMWISNTATTAMMLPIVEAVFAELKAATERQAEEIRESLQSEENYVGPVCETSFYDNPAMEMKESIENDARISTDVVVKIENQPINTETDEQGNLRMERLIKGITLCIPYAASIGGTATLTGTAPNLVLVGQFENLFPDAPQVISFGSWMAYCFPGAFLTLLLSYLWLSWLFLGFDFKSFREIFCCYTCKAMSDEEENVRKVLENEYDKLGEMRWVEGTVLFVFIFTAFLWFFRKPGFIPGWHVLFLDGFVSDGSVAMTMAFILFILPSEKPEFLRNTEGNGLRRPVPAVVDWPTMHRMFPWSVAFLLAGGFALASGATKSGFTKWFGSQLVFLNGIDPWIVCLLVTILMCAFTECSSNTAITSLFVPILADLALSLHVHPLYLMIAPVLAASMAFMLPVATPPNAIAFAYGKLKVIDMIKAGWMLNVFGVMVITLSINTFGKVYFNLNEFPSWAIIATNLSATIGTAINDTALPNITFSSNTTILT